MALFPRDLLAYSADRGAPLILLGYLDDAAHAAKRLTDPDDADALHDFRVAVRRLRATLRAYRPLLQGTVRKKHRRRLRELARATNRGRDSEVQIAWLRAQATRLTAAERSGLARLLRRLDARRRRAYARTRAEVQRRFMKLERRLQRRLAEPSTGAPAPLLAAVAAPVMRRHAADLRVRLNAVTSAGDAPEAHAARIAAKHLRYLFEPIATGVRTGDALVRRLKQLQDLLGEIADAHVLEAQLGDTGRSRDPGIVAAARLVRTHLTELFATLEADWLGNGARRLERDVDRAAASIEGPPPPPSVRARTRVRRRRTAYSAPRES